MVDYTIIAELINNNNQCDDWLRLKIDKFRKKGIAGRTDFWFNDCMANEETSNFQKRNAQPDIQMRINDVLVYIQINLDHRLTLVELANIAGYSPFHIHHIFRALVGETLGGFIQRLRMAKAAEAILKTKLPITEIALQSGYQTPAAFSKAFKQTYNTTPSQVRKTKERPQLVINPLVTVPDIRRKKMEAEIREIPVRKVLTVTRKGSINNDFTKAADNAFSVLTRFISTNRLWHSVESCLGICPDDGVEVPESESRYIAGYFLKEGAQVWSRGEVKEMELPGGKVAVFTHKGPYETLWQTWNKAYRDWLPSSGEKLRDTYPYEVYLNEKGKVPPEELLTEICIPIQ